MFIVNKKINLVTLANLCLLSLVITFAFGFTQVVSAQTPTRLDVTYTPDPLFSENDVKPGDDLSTREAKVENFTSETQTIIIEAVNEIDDTNFGSEIELVILENSLTVFSGTLADFFAGGEITLSDLGPNSTTTYEFYIDVNHEAGNEHQNANISFDVVIGFLGDDGTGGGGGGTGGGGGGSGGGGSSGGNNAGGEENIVLNTATPEPIFNFLPNILQFGLGGTETGGEVLAGEGEEESEDEVLGSEEVSDNNLDQLAGLFSLPDEFMDWLWCLAEALLILLLAFLAWSALDYFYTKKLNLTKKERLMTQVGFYGLWIIIALIVIYLLQLECLAIPLIVFLVALAVLFLSILWRGNDPEDNSSANPNNSF